MNNIMTTMSSFSLRNNDFNAHESIHCFCFLNQNMKVYSSSDDWLYSTTCTETNEISGDSCSISV